MFKWKIFASVKNKAEYSKNITLKCLLDQWSDLMDLPYSWFCTILFYLFRFYSNSLNEEHYEEKQIQELVEKLYISKVSFHNPFRTFEQEQRFSPCLLCATGSSLLCFKFFSKYYLDSIRLNTEMCIVIGFPPPSKVFPFFFKSSSRWRHNCLIALLGVNWKTNLW